MSGTPPLTPEEEAEYRRAWEPVGELPLNDIGTLVVRLLATLDATRSEPAGLREAYIEALVTAWEQAHWIAVRVPNNGVGIVSNIEERFRPFIPDWREAGAEAARRAPLSPKVSEP